MGKRFLCFIRINFGKNAVREQAQAIRILNAGFHGFATDAIYLPTVEMLDLAASAILLNDAFNPAKIFFMQKVHKSIRIRLTKNYIQLRLSTILKEREINKNRTNAH